MEAGSNYSVPQDEEDEDTEPKEQPESRAMFIVMEAFFMFSLGTCNFTSTEWRLQDFFVWGVQNRPYGFRPGNCRTPLLEAREEPFHLTRSERKKLAAAMRERRASRYAVSNRRHRSKCMKLRRYFCIVCFHAFPTMPRLRKHYLARPERGKSVSKRRKRRPQHYLYAVNDRRHRSKSMRLRR